MPFVASEKSKLTLPEEIVIAVIPGIVVRALLLYAYSQEKGKGTRGGPRTGLGFSYTCDGMMHHITDLKPGSVIMILVSAGA
jgi:hypothetical protein